MTQDVGPRTALIGEVLRGTYRIERRIGRGSMGAVYEVSHLRLARRFAAKVLFPAIAQVPDALARFQKEAEVTSALGHPHILEMIDFNHSDDGMPYIIMELLDGEDLGARIGRTGRHTVPGAISIFCQVASALQAAHDGGVVHRDLKPSNIYLCNWGRRDDFVKVLDFGLSKVMGSGMTKSPSLMGTPAYMAPEQAKSIEVDLRADLYALGVILFEMLTGRPPFVANSIADLLQQVVHDDPPSLLEARPELPRSLGPVVARALSKDREQRYGSMAEFMGAFNAVMQHAGFDLPDPDDMRSSSPSLKAINPPEVAPPDQGQSGAFAETLLGPTLPPPQSSQIQESATTAASTPGPPSATQTSTLSATVGETKPIAAAAPRRVNWAAIAIGLVLIAVAGGVLFLRYMGHRKRPATPVAAASPDAAVSPDTAPHPVAVKPTPASPDARPRPDLARSTASPTPGDSGAPPAVAKVQPALRPVRKPRRPSAPSVLKVSTLFNGEVIVARVLLDGKALGESPVFKQIKPGRHLVTVIASGYRKASRRVFVKRGKKTSIVVEMRR